MTAAALLLVPDTSCGRCDRPALLLARIGGRAICAYCWWDLGKPWPREKASPEEIHAAELAARERMLRRGGTDRHMVRKGLT